MQRVEIQMPFFSNKNWKPTIVQTNPTTKNFDLNSIDDLMARYVFNHSKDFFFFNMIPDHSKILVFEYISK